MQAGIRTALLSLLLLLVGVSHAVEVKVLSADRLEVRPITIPGGGESELTVITGSPVRLEVDGDKIVAEYVEFDRESQVLRIVGSGNVAYDNVATKGKDYLLDLGNGDLTFQNVFIFTQPLDIEGVSATRQPGEIDISSAQFSPCSRCASEVQDYRFSAERLNFYPGDRLVAFNVTVYLRELPSFFLPLMVVPLGPEDRRPRFDLQRGTDTERAEIALDWPYFFGANQLGTTSLRYYADVDAGGSNSPLETIFGGTITQSYFGGGFDHRFFTGRGRGTVQFFYTPGFLPDSEFEGAEKTPEEYSYTLGYKTEEALGGFQTDLLLESDDSTNPRIINLTARLGLGYGGFDFAYVTQTYFDLDPTDTSESPSYEENEGSLRTYGQVTVSKQEDLSFSVGPFTLSNFLVSAGVYEDYANPTNQSAQQSGLSLGNGSLLIRGGRLLEQHTINLETLSPFPGSSITGSTSYTGQIYSTTNAGGEFERLVDWTTTLNADQTFNGGSFGLDFSRVILQGETPFSFDARTTPNSRTELSGEVALTPAPWFDLSVGTNYVFQDERGSSTFGDEDSELRWGPLETRLELFNDLDWLGITLEEAYDIKNNDLGLLGGTFSLTSPSTVWTSSLAVSGIYDLEQTTDPLSGAGRVIDETEVDVETRLGYTAYATLGLELGYDFNGRRDSAFGDDFYDPDAFNSGDFNDGYADGGTLEPGSESEGAPLYKPLIFSLTAGTESQEDYIPSLTLSFNRDVNIGRMNSAGYELNARVGPLELSARQDFDFDTLDVSDTLFSITYPDVIQLSASGFTPLAPQTIGLDTEPGDNPVTYQLNLLDQTQEGDPKLYEVTYETTYGPLEFLDFGDTDLGFSETALTGRVNLDTTFLETPIGPLGFGLDFNAILQLPDDAQSLTYLSSSSAQLTADFFSFIGLQGTLSYSAFSNDDFDDPELTSQRLVFTDFGPTVRLFGDLYLSVLLGSINDDVWDFIDPPTIDTIPYNFQPVIYLTLDRCCWAFYGAYNTRNGAISLTLGYPGSSEGLTGAFNTGLALPGRRNP